MYLKELKIGKSIEIFITRDGYRYRIVSKIEDVEEYEISISLISSRNKIFKFEQGDIVEFICKDGDHMWKWENFKGGTKILDSEMVHTLKPKKSTKGKIYNRRDAYRVFVAEEVELIYYTLVKEVDSENQEIEQYVIHECKGFVKDISENGVGIFSSNEFIVGDEVEFTLKTEYGEVYCKAEVLRKTNEKEGKFEYFYGCGFRETGKNLLKIIFNLQRIQLNKIRN